MFWADTKKAAFLPLFSRFYFCVFIRFNKNYLFNRLKTKEGILLFSAYVENNCQPSSCNFSMYAKVSWWSEGDLVSVCFITSYLSAKETEIPPVPYCITVAY